MKHALTCLALIASTPAAALELFPRTTIDMDVSSLAFDYVTCTLWVADESATLTQLTNRGEKIREVKTEFYGVKTLAVTNDGALLVSDGWGMFQRVSMSGKSVGAKFRVADGLYDTEGLHQEPNGDLLIAEDDTARVMRFAPDGTKLMQIDGYTLSPPMIEPQGVTRDPLSGNIFVTDDQEGSDSLFEFSGTGELLSVTPLSPFGFDAEAVTVHALTGSLYVGFDSGRRLVAFDYLPSRQPGAKPLPTGPDCVTS